MRSLRADQFTMQIQKPNDKITAVYYKTVKTPLISVLSHTSERNVFVFSFFFCKNQDKANQLGSAKNQ